MHILHGTLAGGILAVILTSFLMPFSGFYWGFGIAYNLLLWAIAPFALRGVLESTGKVRFTRNGMRVSLASHLVYGLALGIIFQVTMW